MTNPKEVLNDFDKLRISGLSSAEEAKTMIKRFIISSQIATLTSQLEAIPEDEENKIQGEFRDWEVHHTYQGINQERQRQRQSLQLAINKWTELK